MDYYVDEEIDTLNDLPKRQSMKKCIQRGNNMKADYVKKDYDRRSDDKNPYYYASLLLKGSVGKTVDECYTKFLKKYDDLQARDAFKRIFEDKTRNNKIWYGFNYRHWNNYVENGIIYPKIELPRDNIKILINKTGKLYLNLNTYNYIPKHKYEYYSKIMEKYRKYQKELDRYVFRNLQNVIPEPVFYFWGEYQRLINKDPQGIKVIEVGTEIEVSRRSKVFKRYTAESKQKEKIRHKYTTEYYKKILSLDKQLRKGKTEEPVNEEDSELFRYSYGFTYNDY